MAEKDLVIGVDSSTTACKAIAWNAEGKIVAEGRAEIGIFSPNPNWYEQRAVEWWEALCSSLGVVATQVAPERIAALCITNQRETIVPVDQHGHAVRNAITWLDLRARKQVDELDERVGNDRIQAITGKGPAVVQSLPKLLWLQKHEPETVRQTYKFVEVHAFLVQRLTGRWATSLACADPMGAVDMANGTWATDLMQELDIDPDRFVEIVPPGSIIGELTPEAAAATSLPVGLPVVAGAGDGQTAGLGANITRPGIAYLNLGTAMVSGAYSDTYVHDKAFRTLCSPVAGGFVPEEVLAGGTFIVSWFVDNFGPDTGGLNLPLTAEEVLGAAARKVPPGAGGLMLVPYWGGVMPPHWDANATGIVVGWTGAHRREHFYRAVLEGIAFEHRLAMDAIGVAVGQPINEFILMGGGAKSPLWCQIVSDINGKVVRRASTAEATSLGAGILGAAAVGWYSDVRAAADAMTSTEQSYEPDAATHAVYDELFKEVYVDLFPAIRTQIDTLTALTDKHNG